MRILHLTDLHVSKPGDDTYGIDVRANFLNVLARAKELNPDYLVISGDLCFMEPDKTIYAWIREQLDSSGLHYEVMSGNHDDPVVLANAFDRSADLKNGALYYSRNWNNRKLLFLDTTTAHVSEEQRSWLTGQLRESNDFALVFMHHPPLLAGVAYMDQLHSLKDHEEVGAIFQKADVPVYIFTGHYHVEKTVYAQNMTVHITPSCFFQINQQQEPFAVDHRRPALRIIDVQTSYWTSTVEYLDGQKLPDSTE